MEVGKNVLVTTAFEIFAVNIHRDHFFIRQDWGKSTSPQLILLLNHLAVFANDQKDGNDKVVSIYGALLVGTGFGYR